MTLWAEKSGLPDELWWDKKQQLKQDIFLAFVDALGPANVPASAADGAKEAEPARMPDAEDGHIGE